MNRIWVYQHNTDKNRSRHVCERCAGAGNRPDDRWHPQWEVKDAETPCDICATTYEKQAWGAAATLGHLMDREGVANNPTARDHLRRIAKRIVAEWL